MAHPSHVALPDACVNIVLDYENVVDARWLELVAERRPCSIRGDGWITGAGFDALPCRTLVRADYSRAQRVEVLVEFKDAFAHLVLIDLQLHVRLAARDARAGEAALELIREAMPPERGPEEEVPASFWWWHEGPQRMGRLLPAPPWSEVSRNYSKRSRVALERMMGWQRPPAGAGRLVLWHGPPGTGKTTAVRVLAREWRDWAAFHFITDPERFLHNPAYMLATVGERRDSARERWKVVVLEDAGEFLAPDAKQTSGQALSRLLNICDGALGQAMRSLVLATTNEHVRTLHPALARPGRCLADVEYEALSGAEISQWCAPRGLESPDRSAATIAELYAHADGRECPDEERFGFAAAA